MIFRWVLFFTNKFLCSYEISSISQFFILRLSAVCNAKHHSYWGKPGKRHQDISIASSRRLSCTCMLQDLNALTHSYETLKALRVFPEICFTCSHHLQMVKVFLHYPYGMLLFAPCRVFKPFHNLIRQHVADLFKYS